LEYVSFILDEFESHSNTDFSSFDSEKDRYVPSSSEDVNSSSNSDDEIPRKKTRKEKVFFDVCPPPKMGSSCITEPNPGPSFMDNEDVHPILASTSCVSAVSESNNPPPSIVLGNAYISSSDDEALENVGNIKILTHAVLDDARIDELSEDEQIARNDVQWTDPVGNHQQFNFIGDHGRHQSELCSSHSIGRSITAYLLLRIFG
jgi:hypothetical protein